MSIVTFNGTRLTDGSTNNGYSKVSSGGGSPASEPQLAYRKPTVTNVKSSTGGTQYGGLQYTHGSQINMSGATNKLVILKGTISDAGDLSATYGVRFSVGNSNSVLHQYNLAGTGANNDAYTQGYSSQGGVATNYLITCINPNVAQWREATLGSPSLTTIDYLNFLGNWIVGGAKSENLGFGPIDVGVGLNYQGTSFSFGDGADFDQDIDSNRYGLACRNGSDLTLRGLHRIFSGSSGEDLSFVTFPDGYHGTGDFGIEYDTTTNTVQLNGTYKSLGRIYGADDTRADLTFLNSGAASTHSGTFLNYRSIQMQSVITFDGATLRTSQITQNGGTIQNSIINTLSLSGAATLNSDDITKVTNTVFNQEGTGHAIELSEGVGNVSLTGLTFNGYGADGTTSAAINYTGTTAITLSYSGGTKPTVTGNITVLENQNTLTLTGLKNPSKVYLVNTDLPETDANFLLHSQSVNTGEYTYTFTQGVNINALYRIISLSETIIEQDILLGSIDITIPISQQIDRAYENN